MARTKQAALAVPGTRAEAVELTAAYVAADRRMLELKVGYQLQIDALKIERDRILAGLATEQQTRFAALKAWWEAGGKALAGRGRSAAVAGALIGIRKTPPAVRLAKGVRAEDVIAWLKTVEWSKAALLLRTKVELDKPAIIKCVTDSQGEEDLLAEVGVTVEQADEFFIDTGLTEEDARQRLAPAGQDQAAS